MKCQPSQRHASVVATLDHLLHGFDFLGSQARRDDARTARLIIEFAPGLGTTPAVVAGGRQPCDSERRVERQNLPRTLDHSQQDLLGLAFRESFIVESDLGDAKDGDQKTDNRAEQGRPLLVLANLRKQVSTIADKEIAGDHIGRTAVKQAYPRRESSFEWLKAGSLVRGRDLDPKTRRSLPGSGSRKSAERENFASGMHRQMSAGAWADPETSCTFRALQLQRLEARMSWNVAGTRLSGPLRSLVRIGAARSRAG